MKITRDKLKQLSNRIDIKLDEIEKKTVNNKVSKDILLSKELLLFLKYLVEKELVKDNTKAIFATDNDLSELIGNPDIIEVQDE